MGGLAFIALLLVAALLWRRKKAKAQRAPVPEVAPGGYVPEMGDTQKPMYPTSPTPKYAQNAFPAQELHGNHVPVEADGNYQGAYGR